MFDYESPCLMMVNECLIMLDYVGPMLTMVHIASPQTFYLCNTSHHTKVLFHVIHKGQKLSLATTYCVSQY
jgi:hypothetical protein